MLLACPAEAGDGPSDRSEVPPRRRRSVRSYVPVALLILAALSWGTSTALTKVALRQLTPVDLFGIEIGISALPLACLAVARGARLGRPDPLLLLLGLLEPGLAYLLFDLGIRRTAASHAALLLALEAPATLVLAGAFLGERLDLTLAASLALGVAGSVLVTWQSDSARTSVLGDILVIAGTVSAAGNAVLARHVAPSRDPVVVTTVQLFGSILLAVPIFGISVVHGDSDLGTVDTPHLAIAAVVGLLGGLAPFLLFNRAVAHLTASRASLILVLVPVVGAAASLLLLHEKIGGLAVIGGSLALLAAAMAGRRVDSYDGEGEAPRSRPTCPAPLPQLESSRVTPLENRRAS